MNSGNSKSYFHTLFLFLFILFGILLGIVILVNQSNINFERAALGKDMQAFDEYLYEGDRVQCSTIYILACLNDAKERNNKDVVLWIGNSQLHTINNPNETSKTAPAMLIDKLRSRDIDLIAITQPNISLIETYKIFKIFSHELDLKFFILPLVFDDARESNINPILENVETVYKNEGGIKIDKNISYFGDIIDNNQNKILNLQEKSEKKINTFLSDNFTLWDERSSVRSSVNLFLYKLRNTLFRINSSSVRKLIPESYEKNLQSYKSILDHSNISKIKVISYIAPIRDDYKIPYDISEYEEYKFELRRIARKYNQHFYNFEKLVPNQFWGMTDATNLLGVENVDFMHFDTYGHLLLEDAVSDILLK